MARHNAGTTHPSGTRTTTVRAMNYAQRARRGFDSVMEGDAPSDRFMKAALGAAGASLLLNLLRSTPLGSLIARWAPMAVFAVLYQRMTER